ncbi:MAG: SEC-C domain-containing protein [Acidimicrobiales bacterium]
MTERAGEAADVEATDDGDESVATIDLGALDEIRPGAWLAPDSQMVVNDQLVRGRWFAHRITQRELVAGWLEVVPDFVALAAFAREYTTADGDHIRLAEPDDDEQVPHRPEGLVLRGADGWLDGGRADATILLSVDGSALALRWDHRSPAGPGAPSPVGPRFERLGAGHPTPLLDLVMHLLIDAPELFDTEAAPLTELLADAGLRIDGSMVKRVGDAPAERPHGLARRRPSSTLAAERLLRAVLHAADEGAPTAATADIVAALGDREAVAATAEQVVGGGRVAPDLLGRFLDDVATSSPAGQAGAGLAFLQSRLAEWRGDVPGEEAALEVAARMGKLPAALVDRAWFASDRGDARAAIALLRAAGVPADDPELELLARYTVPGPLATGRNEPCWCGSGRKHKHCCVRLNGHGLASRAPWLHGKAVTFLQRPPQRAAMLAIAAAHAGVESPAEAPNQVVAAACDATITELCLFEGGALERFLAQRGSLLPADERALVEAWLPARHRLWEVADGGALLRDPGTGEEQPVDLSSATKLPDGGVVFAVAHAGPLTVPGAALAVGDGLVPELSELIAAQATEPLAALLGREFGWTAAPDLVSTR